MKIKNLNSRLIYSVEYVLSKKTLTVELHRGDIYRYSNVPFSEYVKIRFAESPGSYYTKFIKNENKYNVEKIDKIPLKIR